MALVRIPRRGAIEDMVRAPQTHHEIAIGTRDRITRLVEEISSRDRYTRRLPLNAERVRGEMSGVLGRQYWVVISILAQPIRARSVIVAAAHAGRHLAAAHGHIEMAREHAGLRTVAERELRAALAEMDEAQDWMERLIAEARYDA